MILGVARSAESPAPWDANIVNCEVRQRPKLMDYLAHIGNISKGVEGLNLGVANSIEASKFSCRARLGSIVESLGSLRNPEIVLGFHRAGPRDKRLNFQWFCSLPSLKIRPFDP